MVRSILSCSHAASYSYTAGYHLHCIASEYMPCGHYLAEESIKLNVTPSALNMSGEWVEVGWSGVEQPTDQDWVGVWVLPYINSNINAQTQAPVKYQVS